MFQTYKLYTNPVNSWLFGVSEDLVLPIKKFPEVTLKSPDMLLAELRIPFVNTEIVLKGHKYLTLTDKNIQVLYWSILPED